MTYPQTPGFQAHSDTSREAAERLTTAEDMESRIYALLDTYESGWTCDELAAYLSEHGYPSIQAGTVSARLRGLETKGRAVQSLETRQTRANRPAHVWYSARLAKLFLVQPAASAPAPSPTVQELMVKITRLELENEALRRSLYAR